MKKVYTVNGIWQYWILAFFFAYTPISVAVDFDKGNNILAAMEYALWFYLIASDQLFRKVCSHKLHIIWLVLIIYHWLNNIYHDVPHEYSQMSIFNNFFKCYFLMVFTCYLTLKNEKQTLKFMLYGYLTFIILAAGSAAIAADYTFGEEGERLNGVIHLTQMGATSGMVFFILAFLRHRFHLNNILLAALSAIPIIVIIAAGSRNGLMFMFMGILALLSGSMFKNMSLQKVFYFVLGAIIFYFILQYFLENTYVGERLIGTKEQAEEETFYQTGTILDMLGDRTWYYVVGWSNFLENPIFGIGYDNFRYYNDTIWIVHPEYMLEIAEGGLVATCLFFTFMSILGYSLFKIFLARRDARSVICFMFYTMTLIACLSTTIVRGVQYWPLMGYCISTISGIKIIKASNLRLLQTFLLKKKKKEACGA